MLYPTELWAGGEEMRGNNPRNKNLQILLQDQLKTLVTIDNNCIIVDDGYYLK